MALKDLRRLELGEQVPRLALKLDESVQLIGHLFCQALLIYQLLFDLIPGLLVQLVNTRANRLKLTLFTACQFNHGVEELAIVYFHLESANFKGLKNLTYH